MDNGWGVGLGVMVGVAEGVLVGVRLAVGCGVAEGAIAMAVPPPSGIVPTMPPVAEQAVNISSSIPVWTRVILNIVNP